MQTRQLEYFIAVCETLNFTKAAQKFFISQTAITQQIKALENELGVELFYRNNRHVEISPAGKSFLEDANAIVRRLSDAKTRMQGKDAQLTGTLKIGYVEGYEKVGLSNILADFHEKYPNVFIPLERDNVPNLYDHVLSNEFDLIFNLKFFIDKFPDVEFVDFETFPMRAIVPVSHPLAHRNLIKPKELDGAPLITMKSDNSRYGQDPTIMKFFTDADMIPNVQYVSSDVETSILSVAAGLGFALLPGYITDHINSNDRVTVLPIEGMEKRMTIVVAWNKKNKNPLIKTFLDTINGFRANLENPTS